MPSPTQAQLEEQIDKALKVRLEGNDKFKAGDLQGAMMLYHQVLLSLKGLESAVSQAFGQPPLPKILPDSQEEVGAWKEYDEDAKPDVKPDVEPDVEADVKPDIEPDVKPDPESKAEIIKKAILNTYLNQAAILIKQEKWKRALDCAESAKKIDEKNPKALFREAQARIGLGELNAGKRLLEELQKTNPDSAITAALQKLSLDEKTRGSKTQAQFRGMFNRKPSNDGKAASASNNNNSNHSSSSTVKAEDGTTPKIVELED
ncbi:hypothetical protein JCM10207_004991 [Rhodosporidiobolus poonsookiae]